MSFSPTKCWLPEVNHDERHQKRLCHPAPTRDAEWTVHAVLAGHHQALATSLDVLMKWNSLELPSAPVPSAMRLRIAELVAGFDCSHPARARARQSRMCLRDDAENLCTAGRMGGTTGTKGRGWQIPG